MCHCEIELPITEDGNVPHPVAIIDWDDTLFPNTHFAAHGYTDENQCIPLSEDHKKQLKMYEIEAVKFVQRCLKLATCYIITNGQTGWVEESCKKFLPQLYPLLNELTIISARSTYEKRYPLRPLKWKKAAYIQVLGIHDTSKLLPPQVLAFGDAPIDRQAIMEVVDQINEENDSGKILLKCVKFLENPLMEQMHKQLDLIGGYLQDLMQHNEALDLVLAPHML